MNRNEILEILKEKEMRVTPQRIAVLEAVVKLANHPEVDQIMEYVRKKNSNISLATVYKILEAFTDCGIVHVVKTGTGTRRYDAVSECHHHIYYRDTGKIEDYIDKDLNKLLNDYFEGKRLKGIQVEEIKIQITGKSVGANANVKPKNK